MYIVCWNHSCRQTYPTKDFAYAVDEVRCPKCGDILVSDTGEVQLSLSPDVVKTIDPKKAGSGLGQGLGSSKQELETKSKSESKSISIHPDEVIMFDYTDRVGVSTTRVARVVGIHYGSTPYHPEEQWLLEAYDFLVESPRVFPMAGMSNISRVSPRPRERATT